jgi:hypothetical protein
MSGYGCRSKRTVRGFITINLRDVSLNEAFGGGWRDHGEYRRILLV